MENFDTIGTLLSSVLGCLIVGRQLFVKFKVHLINRMVVLVRVCFAKKFHSEILINFLENIKRDRIMQNLLQRLCMFLRRRSTIYSTRLNTSCLSNISFGFSQPEDLLPISNNLQIHNIKNDIDGFQLKSLTGIFYCYKMSTKYKFLTGQGAVSKRLCNVCSRSYDLFATLVVLI